MKLSTGFNIIEFDDYGYATVCYVPDVSQNSKVLTQNFLQKCLNQNDYMIIYDKPIGPFVSKIKIKVSEDGLTMLKLYENV